MRKHYVKPELETVEVMVELGFAESNIVEPSGLGTETYIQEGSFYHQNQGNEAWSVQDQNTWF